MSQSKKIRVFKNKDKEGWYEKWTKNRDLMNFPHPFRAIVSAHPGSGKTNMIKNIILAADPHFKRIFLCHYCPETKEYEDLDIIPLDEIPDPNSAFFDPKHKSLLIIDDQEFKFMPKAMQRRMDRLWGYTSTHRGLSICCATQNFTNLPPVVRRMSNIFFIWKGTTDIEDLKLIGRKLGLNKEQTLSLFNNCKSRFDQICFDQTIDSPAPIRFNGYDIIE